MTQVGTVTGLSLTAGGSGYVTGGGIKKFTDDLPGLCVPPACPDFNADPAAKYIPLGVPQAKTYDGVEADEYAIGLVQYKTSFSSSLPDTLVRGYVQLETADNAAISQHFPLVNEFLHPIPVTDAAATSTATPETFEVTVGSATQGTFTLTVDQATSAPIPWNAAAATIEAVLGAHGHRFRLGRGSLDRRLRDGARRLLDRRGQPEPVVPAGPRYNRSPGFGGHATSGLARRSPQRRTSRSGSSSITSCRRAPKATCSFRLTPRSWAPACCR